MCDPLNKSPIHCRGASVHVAGATVAPRRALPALSRTGKPRPGKKQKSLLSLRKGATICFHRAVVVTKGP